MTETSPAPLTGGQSDFPIDPAEFDGDERISWSKLDNKHILESEQGTEYEWDTALRRWVPVVSFSPHSSPPNQVLGLRLLLFVHQGHRHSNMKLFPRSNSWIKPK